MGRRSCRRVFTLLLLITACAAGAASAEIYKYVDDRGRVHLTDSIEQVPRKYRSQVRDLAPDIRERGNVNVIDGLNRPAVPRGAEGEGGEAPPPKALDTLPGNLSREVFESLGTGVLVGLALLLPVGFLLSAGLLMLACKLASPEVPGFGTACKAMAVMFLANFAVGFLYGLAVMLSVGPEALESPLASAGSIALGLVASGAVLANMLEEVSFGRGLALAVLHTGLGMLAILLPIGAVVIGLGLAPSPLG